MSKYKNIAMKILWPWGIVFIGVGLLVFIPEEIWDNEVKVYLACLLMGFSSHMIAISTLRKGSIRNELGVFSREKNPIMFWFFITLFYLFSMVMAFVVVHGLIEYIIHYD